MSNDLKDEMLKVLKENGKKIGDIVWVGFCEVTGLGYERNTDGCIDLEIFLVLAKNLKYKKGRAYCQLLDNLVIVGEDWWLEVGQSPASEWLVFKQVPKKPMRKYNISFLPSSQYKLFSK